MHLFEQLFTPLKLRKFIRRHDFWKKNNFCNDRSELNTVLNLLCERVRDDQYKIETNFFLNNNKKVFVINFYDDSLVLRKIAADIKRIYKISTPSRNDIVDQVISLLKDGSSYSVLRTDIKSFFESIPVNNIISKLTTDGIVSPKSIDILKKLYFNETDNTYSFKRGFSTSSILSELFMRNFDKKVKEIEGVYYYNRFVDDIIILSTKNPNELLIHLRDLLDANLKLNPGKTATIQLPCANTQSKGYDNFKTCQSIDTCPERNKSFRYLGYEFIIPCLSKSGERKLEVKLSKTKLNKFKTRITKSFLQYSRDKKFSIFIDRIRFLTDNSKIPSNQNLGKIMTGLGYTYPFLSNPTNELAELDKYLLNCIHCSRKAFKGKIRFSDMQLQEIKKYTFLSGFNNKVSHTLNHVKLSQICECWKYD